MTQLCEGSNIIYTLKAQVPSGAGLSYQWQLNKGNTGWIDVSAPAGQVPDSLRVGFLNAAPGAYQYRLGVSNGSAVSDAVCRVYSPVLTINVTALPVVPPIAPQTICEGGSLKLSASGGNVVLLDGSTHWRNITQMGLNYWWTSPANAAHYW